MDKDEIAPISDSPMPCWRIHTPSKGQATPKAKTWKKHAPRSHQRGGTDGEFVESNSSTNFVEHAVRSLHRFSIECVGQHPLALNLAIETGTAPCQLPHCDRHIRFNQST